MTDDEIAALEAQSSRPSAYAVKLAVDREYVLGGPIRVEIGVVAPARGWVAKRAFDVVLRDDQGRVVQHVRPYAEAVAKSGFPTLDHTFVADYVLASESYTGVFALLLPSECLSPNREYTIAVRLLQNDAAPASATAAFRARAPSSADDRLRAELGIAPYLEEPLHYALLGDVRPALALRLEDIGADVPWRYSILLAHLYAGAADPESIPPEILARLSGGAYALSAPRLLSWVSSSSQDHEFFARDRRSRLAAGPAKR
ncbi:MAG: hypothetical protein U0414_40365 [Polyangiaceae bacterium]